MAVSIPDRLREPSFRFVLVKAKDKGPIEKDWQKGANYPCGDPKLSKHLGKDGNYGILCGIKGLAVIDADSPEVATAVEESLPLTFTVQTGRGGRHFYYRCADLPGPLRLARPGDAKGTIGDVQSTGKQVIGPGSVHPNGNAYTVLKDLPIASVKAEQIRTALSDFLPPPETDTPEDVRRELPNRSRDVDLDSLKVQDVIPMDGLKGQGGKFRGSCPWHGSNTGHNFEVDVSKNAWYCFRHGTGGGPLHAIAVQEKVLDCADCIPGALKAEKFKRVLEIAQDKHGLKPSPRQVVGASAGMGAGKPSPPSRSNDKTQAEVVIEAAIRNGIEPFMDQHEEAYAAIEVKGHREIVRIRSSRFSLWLQHLHYLETEKSLNKDALGQAVATFEAKALFEGAKRPLSLRRAWREGDLYYDLCDEAWRAVRISPSIKPYGWEIVGRPPILFKRERHMKAQVEPVPGGSWDELWTKVLNFLPEQWVLCKPHVLQLFIPGHPIAFLNPNNRKGAAKTSTAKVIRELVDPSSSPLQELNNPRTNLNDLFEQNFLPIFDNVDGDIKDFIFNKLCRVNTGEASQERELYKNKEQVLYEYQRTAIITSIAPVGPDHPDFVQRTVYVGLRFIPEEERKDEEQLKADFTAMRGQVLGFIFSTLSKALGLKNEVHLDRRPRMADYAIWGEALSRALGEDAGKFIAAYQGSIKSGVEEALNADPLALAIMQMFAEPERLHYIGPADDLYRKLSDVAKEKSIDISGKRWPGAANALSRRMREIVDDLKDQGIYYARKDNSELSGAAQRDGKTTDLASNRKIMLLIKKGSPHFSEIPRSEGYSNDISSGDEKYRDKSQQTKIGENHDITIFSTPLDCLPSQDEKVAGLRKLVESGRLRMNDLERIAPEQKATIDRLRKDGQIGTDPNGTLYWIHK
ncbi:bifunctional DNA primase/polymerase [Methanomassiliicoccus luminyensis]|uniref:bifunctional DNA primase/polymerase n=1 Tax=Methanomassiliicoccus luminyensis TaxID=1080712 RepID=UPI00036FF6D8|nr:bifunctional DNA primase/polymerase [Methanomassiliicoccus luminyensis]